jgi:hypothetical protein
LNSETHGSACTHDVWCSERETVSLSMTTRLKSEMEAWLHEVKYDGYWLWLDGDARLAGTGSRTIADIVGP